MSDTLERTLDRHQGVGARVARKEDDRLLRGEGRFTDDTTPAHALHMAIVRSPFPRARIASIDISAALAVDGVRQILVGADIAERTTPITVMRPVPDAVEFPFWALAQDVASYEGQPVVSVVASSRHVAEDAAELVEVDYEPLPHVSDVISAMAPDAPVLHPDHMTSNLVASNPQGTGDPEARFASADVVVEDRFFVNRVSGLPMETRAIIAAWRPGARELTVQITTQTPHLIRKQLAEILGLDEGGIRVVTGDVGGAFGLKLGVYPEDVLACLHAIDLRRPIKWTEDRLEFFRATTHAREAVHNFRIAANADGEIVAMTDVYATDLGAYNGPFGSAQLSSVVFTGPYRVEDAAVERQVVVTNKTPIGAYRGYGQPEVNFARERLMDRLARRLGIDPLELRRQNMLRPEDLPWINASGARYDSGDYPQCLQMAADAIDYEGLRRAGRRRADGRLVGIGLSSFVERTGYASARFLAHRKSRFGAHESVTLRANNSGGVDLYTGVSTFGQSNETAFAQLCSEALGIDYDAIAVHAGDTGASPLNTGAFASRTLIAAAGAIEEAARLMREKILRIAAYALGVEDPTTLDVSGRSVVDRAHPERSMPLSEVHMIAIVGQGLPPGMTPGLDVTSYFEPKEAAFAYGTAAAVVVVDPETGDFDIERFVMVHDCGTVVNPQAVDGQVRGALVQGFGAALGEELRYDAETGQLVSGSMLDYFVPTACDVPPIELQHTQVPSPDTTLGVRGVGEIGTIPAGATVANAICDALADLEVEITSLPITPQSVWHAIQQAQSESEAS